jgi:hypothetical protein
MRLTEEGALYLLDALDRERTRILTMRGEIRDDGFETEATRYYNRRLAILRKLAEELERTCEEEGWITPAEEEVVG